MKRRERYLPISCLVKMHVPKYTQNNVCIDGLAFGKTHPFGETVVIGQRIVKVVKSVPITLYHCTSLL